MVVAITQGSRSRGALREAPTKRLADVRPVLVPAKPRRTSAPMVLIDGVRGLLEFIPVSSIPSFMNCLRTASRADWSKLWLMNPMLMKQQTREKRSPTMAIMKTKNLWKRLR